MEVQVDLLNKETANYVISHPLDEDEVSNMIDAIYGYEGWTAFNIID